MDTNNEDALEILRQLDREVTPQVKRTREVVCLFLSKFLTVFENDVTTSFRITAIHGGSSDEHLAVDDKTDFDITVSLGGKFVSENFIVERDPRGFFILKAMKYMKFLNCDNFLDSSYLRENIFDVLLWCIKWVKIPKTRIRCKRVSESAVIVKLQRKSGLKRKIFIYLVPQIPFHTWGQCPDLLPLQEMPECLREHIKRNIRLNPCMFFSFVSPLDVRVKHLDQLFNPSFSLLEKNFINEETDIRDMVRLVKYIAKKRHWKDSHHFKSFYAKRVALKHYDELKGMEPWDGCQRLLQRLEEQVTNQQVIDGYFVRNQPLRKWRYNEAQEFIREIRTVKGMCIRDI
ncbi:uncharacterized protein [Palaemon carinicauda]|uniref:uncharacterized protein n=1 Tax=Palaemon carinicauda TaxID=392227 RepID=UPI0035B65D68